MGKALLLLAFAAALFTVEAAAQCPTISVKGPTGITLAGEDMTFSAEVNVVGPKLTYVWSVDKGTITSGQGTPKITVSTDRSIAGEAVKANVNVTGLPESCLGTASEMAGIAPAIDCGMPSDEWYGEMRPNDQRGRLDVFFAELSNNPTNVGLVFLGVEQNEKLDSSNSRIQFMLKHVRFRKFDKSRIWFVLEPSEERSTRFYRMPPGAEPPPCEGCLLFKGEHL